MIKNSTLVKLMRTKIILDEIERGTYPSVLDLQKKIEQWQERISYVSDDINSAISERTIKRDIKDIKQVLDVDIEYSKTHKGYCMQVCQENNASQDMLDALQFYFLLKNIPDANNYIRFSSRKAKGTEYFFLVLDAIRKQKKLRFEYFQYEKQERKERIVSPLGLKEFKGFWYLIATDDGKSIKTFGLDRISNLNSSTENAVAHSNFDLDDYYEHCYGIVRIPDMKAQEIIIRTTAIKARYYTANPLHHSQKLIKETSTHSTFSLYMYLTYDLLQELRSHGSSQVEVLQPKGALDIEI